MIVATLFNLLFNATLSFLAGLLVALVAIKMGRIERGRWQLYFISLPFVKIVYDVVRWIPADSYMWRGVDPLAVDNHRELLAWIGSNHFGPYFGTGIRIISQSGERFSLSFGDMVARWLQAYGTASLPTWLVGIAVMISVTLVVRRLGAWLKHEWRWSTRRQHRRGQTPNDLLTTVRVGRRSVDVHVVDDASEHQGMPFAGGLIRPYVVFPRALYARLSSEERAAALAHEIAHVRHGDLPQALIIALLGDVFWFVPGYAWLKRRLEDLRELLADQAAVREGADPLALASALVTTRLHWSPLPEARSYSAFAKRYSLLERRVQALVSPPVPCERSVGIRAVFAVITTAAILTTTLGGNRIISHGEPFSANLAQKIAAFVGLFDGGMAGF